MVIEISVAKTQKGRNRLREHGSKWDVIRNDTLDNKDALLTTSVKTGYLRWWTLDEIEYKEVQNETGLKTRPDGFDTQTE